MNALFEIKELPLEQLGKIGLYQDRQLLLSASEIQAMLAGRRTELIPLHQLKGDGFLIERLDARLSLSRLEGGEIELLIHPIYKQTRLHPMLSDDETQDLIDGKRDFISKSVAQEEGRFTMFNIEFDKHTNDFVGYEVSSVQAPDRVNGILLSQEEKASFSRGDSLELSDGTRLKHRASEPLGLLSDRKALVLSVLFDGGISYLLLRGIRSLNEDTEQMNHHTPAFDNALAEMEGNKRARLNAFEPTSFQIQTDARKVSR